MKSSRIFKIVLGLTAILVAATFIFTDVHSATPEYLSVDKIDAVTFSSIVPAGIASDRLRAVSKAIRNSGKSWDVEFGYLAVEQELLNNKSLYKFDFRAASNGGAAGNNSPINLLLDQSDLFISIQTGLFLYEKVTATPEYIRGGLQTSINPLYWTTGVGFTIDHLRQVYNSRLKFQVANHTYSQNFDTSLFYTQHELQGDLTNNIMEQRYGDIDGYYVLPEFHMINGQNDSRYELSIPLFNGVEMQAVGAGLQNMVVLKHQGILIRGGADEDLQNSIGSLLKDII